MAGPSHQVTGHVPTPARAKPFVLASPPPGFASPTAETVPGAFETQQDNSDSDVEIVGYEIISSSPQPTCSGKQIPEQDTRSAPSPAKVTHHLMGDGSQTKQPLTEPALLHPAEPFHDLDKDYCDDIPEISDELAPKFQVGEPQLSPAAIKSRAKRIFTKRADGSKKVSDEIWCDWKSKGPKRKLLEEIFKQCGYDPDPRLMMAPISCSFFKTLGGIQGLIFSVSYQRLHAFLQIHLLG